jgi:uridylate kinase
MDRVSADQMGMLATMVNGLALADAVRRAGARAELFTAWAVGPVGTMFRGDVAARAIDDGALAIITGGTGNPFFSTDSAAALRAAELSCGLLLKGTKVDGVYDKDPATHADARRFDRLTATELIDRRLGVVDLTAAAMCRDNGIAMRVYRMVEPGAIGRAALGEPLGTLVEAV